MFIGIGIPLTSHYSAGPTELNPDSGLDLGAAGWAQTAGAGGSVVINAGSVDFEFPTGADGFVPTGANKVAFDAAVPSSTVLVNRITIDNYSEGRIRVKLKGGAFVTLTANGNGVFIGNVTSGTLTTAAASGIFGVDGFEPELRIDGWSIATS